MAKCTKPIPTTFFDGRKFPSRTQAAKAIGVSEDTLRYYQRNDLWPFSEQRAKPYGSKSWINSPITAPDGRSWPDGYACAAEFNITLSGLKRGRQRKNYPFGEQVCSRHARKEIRDKHMSRSERMERMLRRKGCHGLADLYARERESWNTRKAAA